MKKGAKMQKKCAVEQKDDIIIKNVKFVISAQNSIRKNTLYKSKKW